MLSPSPDFFQTKRSISEIKAELLPAYFQVWQETAASEELVLADLNTGTGYETNGEKPAALQILGHFQEAENATENETKTLSLFLGDASKTNLEKLKQNLQIQEEEEPQLPENIFLLNEPEIQERLLKVLQKVPGLVVADPFSYVAAQEIVADAIQNTTTDLFLFFDYKKLEKTFLADANSVLLNQLFGDEMPEIKFQLQRQKSLKLREQFLMAVLEKSLREQGFYPVSFKFNAPGKGGSAAYLIIANKRKAAYCKAKEWLQTFSEKQEDGVPLFGVNQHYQPAAIPGFSDFLNKFSLEGLTQELAGSKTDFHYQTIREIYETHSLRTNYVLANYLAAFQKLSKAGTVNLVDASNKKVLKVTPNSVVFYKLHYSK